MGLGLSRALELAEACQPSVRANLLLCLNIIRRWAIRGIRGRLRLANTGCWEVVANERSEAKPFDEPIEAKPLEEVIEAKPFDESNAEDAEELNAVDAEDEVGFSPLLGMSSRIGAGNGNGSALSGPSPPSLRGGAPGACRNLSADASSTGSNNLLRKTAARSSFDGSGTEATGLASDRFATGSGMLGNINMLLCQ